MIREVIYLGLIHNVQGVVGPPALINVSTDCLHMRHGQVPISADEFVYPRILEDVFILLGLQDFCF